MSRHISKLSSNFLTQSLRHCKQASIIDTTTLNRNIGHSASPSMELETPSEDLKREDVVANSLRHKDFFGVSNLFTVEDLFHAKVHLGHKVGSLNNYMRPYIFGSRLGHLIMDLDHTSSLLRSALNFAAHIAFRGGIILFICRGAQHQMLVENSAKSCGEFSHTREWFHGTLTNSTKFYGCITRLPDLIIFPNTLNDVLNQHEAVKDAGRMLIPTVGIVDTNCDPRLISYPVPGNDDSASAVSLYCYLFGRAIELGKNKRKLLKLDT